MGFSLLEAIADEALGGICQEAVTFVLMDMLSDRPRYATPCKSGGIDYSVPGVGKNGEHVLYCQNKRQEGKLCPYHRPDYDFAATYCSKPHLMSKHSIQSRNEQVFERAA